MNRKTIAATILQRRQGSSGRAHRGHPCGPGSFLADAHIWRSQLHRRARDRDQNRALPMARTVTKALNLEIENWKPKYICSRAIRSVAPARARNSRHQSRTAAPPPPRDAALRPRCHREARLRHTGIKSRDCSAGPEFRQGPGETLDMPWVGLRSCYRCRFVFAYGCSIC
jgi:hypothetical protein